MLGHGVVTGQAATNVEEFPSGYSEANLQPSDASWISHEQIKDNYVMRHWDGNRLVRDKHNRVAGPRQQRQDDRPSALESTNVTIAQGFGLKNDGKSQQRGPVFKNSARTTIMRDGQYAMPLERQGIIPPTVVIVSARALEFLDCIHEPACPPLSGAM